MLGAAAQGGNNDDDRVLGEGAAAKFHDVEAEVLELKGEAEVGVKEALHQARTHVDRAAQQATAAASEAPAPLESIKERLDKLERAVQHDGATAEELGLSLEALEDDNKSMLEMYVRVGV